MVTNGTTASARAAVRARDEPPEQVAAFLDGAGATARLVLDFDWSVTSLGPLDAWPDWLCIAAAMVLRSPVAMALMVGEDGILLYNDGYAVIAGQRHPAVLGASVFDAWPAAAEHNRHVMRAGMAGQSLSYKDLRLTSHRNGTPEDIWLDLGYSPVLDWSGRPAAVLAVVAETTARNLADERLRIAQEAGRFGIFEWFPETNSLAVSDVYREIYGLPPDEAVTSQRLFDLVLPEDRGHTGYHRFGLAANPLSYAEVRIRHGASGDIRWIARRGDTVPGGGTAPPRFIGVAWDITERKTAERHDAFLAALTDRLRDLSDAREIVSIASEMLGRYLGASRAGFAAINETATQAVIEQDWTDGTVPSLVGCHEIEAFGLPLAEALRRGDTFRLADVRTDPRLRDPDVSAAYEGIGMLAGITVPLIRDGRFTGALFAHCAQPRDWTDSDEAIVRDVAARTWDTAQRARAEQRLRESEEDFRQLAQAMPIHVWVADPSGRVTWVNDRAYAYFGVAPGELQRADWGRMVHPDDRESSMRDWTNAVRSGEPLQHDHRILCHDGTWRWHLVRVLPIRGADGKIIRWIGTNTDIDDERRARTALAALNATLEERVEARTRELREAEAALRQAQKMEAIGQLTGGIAHDFNNLLTGIIGSLELLRRRLDKHFPGGDGAPRDLDRYMEAASSSALRAAALTHRLLAFARRQSLDTKPTNTADLVHGMADLLRRTLGEQVDLRIDIGPGCWDVLTDAHQLESAILNLAINARDAMPAGGVLTIAAANAVAGPESADALGRIEPGDYVAISAADTGTGMPEEVREKAFEPFFTTKPTGQGTGLGLSMVYGFARQSGGHAHIASQPGAGTTVTLYLPRATAGLQPPPAARTALPGGDGETVLVVEDVAAVRMLIVEALNELGYRTIEAADATGALPVIGSDTQIDLLISDVGLPGLNGRQIADYARTRRPGLKVLFVTGYAGPPGVHGVPLEDGMAIITKPFAIEQLASRIRDMLSGVTPPPHA